MFKRKTMMAELLNLMVATRLSEEFEVNLVDIVGYT